MNFFSDALGRLKSELGVSKDQEVATFLGLGKTAFSERKKRRSFPEREVLALSASRPELKLDVTYILTGERVSELQRQQLAVLGAVIEKTGNIELAQKFAVAYKTIGLNKAHRKPIYKNHEGVLDLCTDEDVELVMKLAVRLATGRKSA